MKPCRRKFPERHKIMEGKRQYLLDGLRGLTLISMILYHGMFDLLEIYGVHVSWFWRLPGIIWQQSICWSFIILSGFCWNLSRNPVKNGLVVSAGGLLVSAVTWIFMPEELVSGMDQYIFRLPTGRFLLRRLLFSGAVDVSVFVRIFFI